jgi:hypothetical protein
MGVRDAKLVSQTALLWQVSAKRNAKSPIGEVDIIDDVWPPRDIWWSDRLTTPKSPMALTLVVHDPRTLRRGSRKGKEESKQPNPEELMIYQDCD